MHCKRPVRYGQQAVDCDECHDWQHLECRTGKYKCDFIVILYMSEYYYFLLALSGSSGHVGLLSINFNKCQCYVLILQYYYLLLKPHARSECFIT
jgi:hypothetical protein